MATYAADHFAENMATVAGSATSAGVDSAVITTSPAFGNISTLITIANPNRKGALIWNNGSNSAYICYAPTANSSACTDIIPSFTSWKMPQPCYRGQISAIRNVTTLGTLVITELI